MNSKPRARGLLLNLGNQLILHEEQYTSAKSNDILYQATVEDSEVSLAHLAREVDVQPSHPGSSPHRHEFGFLFSKKQNRYRGFSYRISFKKRSRT
jgi:hypothetical protein